MADNPAGKDKPSWRQASRADTRPSEPVVARRGWNRRAEAGPSRSGPSRRRLWMTAGVVGGFLLFLALAVILPLLLRPAKSVLVVLAGADYADNLAVPANALGWNGLEAIQNFANTKAPRSLLTPPQLNVRENPRTLASWGDWNTLINELVARPPSERTILFVVSLHGGTDAGGAYLVPGATATPEDRIPLTKLIKSFSRLPSGTNKIVVLEGSQVAANPGQGVLFNDFNQRLKGLEDEIRKVPNLWVLSGADTDQRCWGSEGLGRTALVHFLLDTLRGREADVGPDGRLSLEELHRSVLRRVRSWAWAARGEVQEPVLLPRPIGGQPKPGDILLPTMVEAVEAIGEKDFKRSDVQSKWEEFHRLNALVPHPSVYSPRRWRLYRATLVRFEELYRGGMADRANTALATPLSKLANQIIDDQFLPGPSKSAETSLAANVVFGGPDEPRALPGLEPPPLQKRFDPVASPRDWADWVGQREKLAPAGGDKSPSISARSQAGRILVARAIAEPSVMGTVVVPWLDHIEGGVAPHPIEAHYARILGRWRTAADPAFDRVVAQAMDTRFRAERAVLGLDPADPAPAAPTAKGYHHAEEVAPWTASLVDAADRDRRTGEDLLFAADPSAWAEATTAFRKAVAGYAQADRTANVTRDAIAARDRLLADLPFYSRWLAHRLPDQLEGKQEKQGDPVEVVERLWATAHDLARLTEEPTPAAVDQLAPLVAQDQAGFDTLIRHFRESVEAVPSGRHAADFEAVTALAAIPFADTAQMEQRGLLWERLKDLREEDVSLASDTGSAQPGDEDRRASDGRRRLRAAIEARMALATLGSRRFDDPATAGTAPAPPAEDDTFAGDVEWARGPRPVDDADADAAAWDRRLDRVADKVGARTQALLASLPNPSDPPRAAEPDLGSDRRHQASLDRMARECGEPQAQVQPEPPDEPTIQLRRIRVHDLLLRLARRTWDDHWDNDDPPGNPHTPYHLRASAALVEDADKLVPKSAAVARDRVELARKVHYDLAPPEKLVLTSEQALDVEFRVVRPESIPPGRPVTRPVPAPPVRLQHQADRDWRIIPPEAPTVPFAINGEGTGGPRTRSQVRVAGELYFRGKRTSTPAPVDVYPEPDLVVIGGRPAEAARVAVRAQPEVISQFGVGTGAIAIVLDCSGSMGKPTWADPNGRFAQAVQALDRVLAGMPENTEVSVHVFGEAKFRGQPVKDLVKPIDPVIYGRSPDARFHSEHPEETIETIREPAPWKPAQQAELISLIKKQLPYHETPLIAAMGRAKQKLNTARRLKTLVVLTDGNDTQFQSKLDPKDREIAIREHLSEQFGNEGIVANLVFFELPAAELAKAEANFSPFLRFNPPGHIYQATDINRLVDLLARSINQQLTWTLTPVGGNGAQAANKPSPIPQHGEDLFWSGDVPAGNYLLKIQANSEISRNLLLSGGDRLIVNLVIDQGKIGFARGLYSGLKREVPNAFHRDASDTRLADLASVVDDDRGTNFRLLASLESLRAEDGALRHQPPALIWFDLKPQGTLDPPAPPIRWWARDAFPAPVWRFDSPRWSRDPAGLARPGLTAWWSDDPDAATVGHVELNAAQGRGRERRNVVLDNGQKIVLEGIALETHAVEHRPGEPPAREKCLVIRIDSVQGEPILVDPEGVLDVVGATGYEHRIYAGANKSATFFWPVDDTRERLQRLDLLSVAKLRQQAAGAGHTITVDGNDVPRPAVGEPLPSPVE